MAKIEPAAEGYRAPAVERAFQLLDAVADAPYEPRLSDLARTLGISKSSTHGLVRALQAVGALDQDPESRRFSLGPCIVALALKNRHYPYLGEQARPLLDRLRDRIDETVFFGMMSPAKTLILAAAEARKSMKITARPGTAIPLLAGAVGKVLLAQMKEEEARQTIRRLTLPRYTPASIVDEERFLDEIRKVRQTGVAVDRGEYLSGVNAVAVGLDRRHGVPMALWAVGFAESMGADKIALIGRKALETADGLKEAIGSVSSTPGK